MRPVSRNSRLPPEVFQYSGLGCVFAAGVMMFTAGGWLVDRWLGVFPALTIVGSLLGVALSSLSVWRRMQEDSSSDDPNRRP